MKILVVGGGGREHAIIKSLKKNPEVLDEIQAKIMEKVHPTVGETLGANDEEKVA